MSNNKELAQSAKGRGNTAFTGGDFPRAVTEFTTAIELDPTDHIFYSNRSGAYASLKQYEQALTDAEKCVQLNGSFVKGHSRKGGALFGLGRYDDAIAAYEAGIAVDPNNAQCKEGIAEARRALASASGPFGGGPFGGPGGAGADPFGKLFGPEMWNKLAADSSTSHLIADPGFRSKMEMLQKNPKLLSSLIGDPHVSAALGVLLNLGAGAFKAMDPEEMGRAEKEEQEREKKRKAEAAAEVERKRHEEDAAREAGLSADDKEKLQKQRAAQAEKDKGNEFYKKKDFTSALQHYDAALALDPTNIQYLNNKAAVYFEQKEYELVISTCRKALDTANEVNANFKDKARAWERIGNVHVARNEIDAAIQAYDSCLLEDHSDKVRATLKKLLEQKKKSEAEAYLDKNKSEEAKERGNQLYKDGKFKAAIDEYNESLKRDPTNYKVYTNRANCFSKLMEWNKALEDCEKALAFDSKFVKAFIRKGKIHHFLKQYHKALESFEKGLAIEPSNVEILEERRKTIDAINSGDADPERAKRAMEDPEIQSILRDPTINKVLQDMQQNPQSAQAALRDHDIKSKIEKLVAAGVLQVK